MKLALVLFVLPFYLLTAAQENLVVQTYQSPLYSKIEHVCISPDSQTILAADSGGYVFFWNKSDGALAKIMRAHNHAITHFAVSDDGKYFATTSADKHIFLWDFASGQKAGELKLDVPCTALVFTNYGLIYAAGNAVYFSQATKGLNGSIEIFQSNELVTSGVGINGGKHVAVNAGNTLTILSSKGNVIAKAKSCAANLLSAGENQVCATCKDGALLLFAFNDTALHQIKKMDAASSPVQLLVRSATNSVLYLTSKGNTHVGDWQLNKQFIAGGLPQPATALGDAGRFILLGNQSGQVMLCKTEFTRTDAKQVKEKAKAAAKNEELLNERPVKLQGIVEVKSRQLDIYIWDDENVDGDTISLSMNGNWILSKHLVTKEKKKVTITLTPEKKNVLALYAENLGSAPPNTAVISFNDGNKERTLTLNSDLKRCDAVNFILKQ